jgi:hypothetical protein
MRKLLVSCICITLLIGCRETISPKSLGLSYKKETTVNVKGRKMSIKLDKINEGRCIGEEINCIWGGLISVDFIVENSVKVSLSTLRWYFPDEKIVPENNEMVSFKLGHESYLLQLQRIDIQSPDRGYIARTPKENYSVFVRISKN